MSDFDIKLKNGQGTRASRGKYKGWKNSKKTKLRTVEESGKLKNKDGDRVASLDGTGKVLEKS